MEQRLPSFAGRGSTGAYCRYNIEDRSYTASIKKDISKEAEALGFSAEKVGRLQIVIAEVVSNLVKFGERNRELLWKTIWHQGEAGIELLTLDKGPGISSVSQALEDGYSTSGTAGEGLGAVLRQSDFLELYSQRGEGTVLLTRMFANGTFSQKDQPLNFAALSVAKPGEELCGDGYFIEYGSERQVCNLLVLDGLGHGAGAYEAAKAAIVAYAALPKEAPHAMLRKIHQQIKNTRGGVAMALNYNFKEEVLLYCGVGNITGKKVDYQTVKHFSSFNGIVGHVMSSRIHDQEMSWERGSFLVVHSDGLTSRWNVTKYPQVQKYDPAILAACLYRDHSRGNDDTTIVICKHPITNGKGSTAHH